jgi:hypothetical protein
MSYSTSDLFVVAAKAIMLPPRGVISNLPHASYCFVVGVAHKLLCGSNKKKLRFFLVAEIRHYLE